MRGSEMLTASGGTGTAPSTASSSSAAAADLVAGAGGLGAIGVGGGGGNFPLAVALLAFACANFINLLSIWCVPRFPYPRSKSNARGRLILGRWFRRDCSRLRSDLGFGSGKLVFLSLTVSCGRFGLRVSNQGINFTSTSLIWSWR
jgi:hypothetical protein